MKWFVDVALPEATNTALRYIRTIADRAVALTQAIPSGPVHLNMPFREPLTPETLPNQPLPPPTQRDPIAWYGHTNNTPYIAVNDTSLTSASATEIRHLTNTLSTTPRGLIIAGPYDSPALAAPLIQMAHRLGYPILADPLSQLRCGDLDHTSVLSSYDAFLRINSFVEEVAPRLVLRFGAVPTSKPLQLYLKHHATCPQIVIDGHAAGRNLLNLRQGLYMQILLLSAKRSLRYWKVTVEK